MRLIDKYLLREFLLPLVYCFDAFVMLFVVLDLFDKLGDFIQHHASVLDVVRYYLIVLPEAIVLMLPMSLLLAVLYCLSNLGKNNELIALRASGISILRMATPFLCVGGIVAGTVFVVNETFVPTGKERADAMLRRMRGRGGTAVVENFFFDNVADHRDWYARRFHTGTKRLETVEIHQRRADGSPVLDLFAQSAVWTNGGWQFTNVELYDHSQTPEQVSFVAQTNFPAFREPPKQLAIEGRRPNQLLTRDLRRYIRMLHQFRRTNRLSDYEVEYAYRYAFPLTSLLVIWIGFPLGVTISRRGGAMLGVGMALVLFVVFYFLTHISLALGKGEHIPAPLAAWLTNIIFGVVGTVLMLRAR